MRLGAISISTYFILLSSPSSSFSTFSITSAGSGPAVRGPRRPHRCPPLVVIWASGPGGPFGMRQGAISISISISTYFFLLFFSFLSSCLACFLHNQCGQWPGSQGTTMPPPMPTSGGNISVMPRGVPLVCALVLLVLFFSFLFYSCLVDFLHNQCGQWPGSQGTTMPTPMPTSGGNISVMPRGVPLVCALVLLVLVLVLIFSRRLVDFLHNQCGHLAGSRGPTMPALMPTSGGNMSLVPPGVPLACASYLFLFFIFIFYYYYYYYYFFFFFFSSLLSFAHLPSPHKRERKDHQWGG